MTLTITIPRIRHVPIQPVTANKLGRLSEPDLVISSTIFLFYATTIASSTLSYLAVHAVDFGFRLAINHMKNKGIISSKTKEYAEYVSGGLAFAASYSYCLDAMLKTVGLGSSLNVVTKAFVSGFMPMLYIAASSKISEKLIPSNANNHDDSTCFAMAAKIFLQQGARYALSPYTSNVVGTLGAYFIASFLHDKSRKCFVRNPHKWACDVLMRTRNSSFAAEVANNLQPVICSYYPPHDSIFDSMTYDTLYCALKKAAEMIYG